MNFASSGGDDEVVATINTTPLVDVMLVLLIIFLITIPVVTHTVPVSLPKEATAPRQSKPENIVISIDRSGDVFWNRQPVADSDELFRRLSRAASATPQPEVHIRGDEQVRYEAVGRVLDQVRRAAIRNVSFITQPPPKA